MVSLDSAPAVSKAPEAASAAAAAAAAAGTSSPRVSFSSDFFDEKNFITISPGTHHHAREDKAIELARGRNGEFEFLSGDSSSAGHMPGADELFHGGKLLPSWQKQQSEKLGAISLKAKGDREGVASEGRVSKGESRVSWYVDDDPSPRPPKCTVLWKELLRLKKQRASSSSSTPPSSSSTSSSSRSLAKMASIDEEKELGEGEGKKEKHIRRIKKGLERTRSASIRIRPMVNVPVCTQGRGNGLPPLFSLRKEVREGRR